MTTGSIPQVKQALEDAPRIDPVLAKQVIIGAVEYHSLGVRGVDTAESWATSLLNKLNIGKTSEDYVAIHTELTNYFQTP